MPTFLYRVAVALVALAGLYVAGSIAVVAFAMIVADNMGPAEALTTVALGAATLGVAAGAAWLLRRRHDATRPRRDPAT